MAPKARPVRRVRRAKRVRRVRRVLAYRGPVGVADGDLSGQVTAVTIDSAAGQKVKVRFTLADAAGLPVTDAATNNFEFQIAKLVPASDLEAAVLAELHQPLRRRR